jgi:hypothetical protein
MCDLDVIGRDLGLVFWGNDQALLLRARTQLKSPRGYAVYATARQIGPPEVRLSEARSTEISRDELGPA